MKLNWQKNKFTLTIEKSSTQSTREYNIHSIIQHQNHAHIGVIMDGIYSYVINTIYSDDDKLP